MIKRILFAISVLTICATAISARPRLIVTIAIDGLQPDHIATLNNNFERGGLRKLTGGIAMPWAQSNYIANDVVVDYASLMTGSTPRYHGITSNRYYNFVEDDLVSIIYDGRFHGINSALSVSPMRLASTTLADIVKLNNPKSKVYAVALDADNALIFGGHAADGAIWLDDETAQLATTNFYKNGLPTWATKINQSYTISNYLAYEWRPLHEIGTYKFAPQSFEKEVFSAPNDNLQLSEQVYRFKHAPFVNTLMKDLAIRAMRDEKMGIDAATDFLMVQFSVKLPNEQGNALLSAEKEDMYLRLDHDVRLLLDAIDLSVGLDNTLIVVVAGNEEPYSLKNLSQQNIVTEKFNAKRAMALLNSYLMAIYGQGRYVSDYHNGNIYLNKTFIDKQKIDRNELEQHVAQFMTEFQGVQEAYTSSEIKLAAAAGNDELSRIHNSAFRGTSGDVIFTLKTGWAEVNERGEIINASRARNITMPVYFYSENLPNKTLTSGVKIIDIVPTICNLLQLPMPNAATGDIIAW